MKRAREQVTWACANGSEGFARPRCPPPSSGSAGREGRSGGRGPGTRQEMRPRPGQLARAPTRRGTPPACRPTQSILLTWSSMCGISSLAAPLTRAVATCGCQGETAGRQRAAVRGREAAGPWRRHVASAGVRSQRPRRLAAWDGGAGQAGQARSAGAQKQAGWQHWLGSAGWQAGSRSAAQPSCCQPTAQHSTAQHSTAQRSTAQHSAAAHHKGLGEREAHAVEGLAGAVHRAHRQAEGRRAPRQQRLAAVRDLEVGQQGLGWVAQ